MTEKVKLSMPKSRSRHRIIGILAIVILVAAASALAAGLFSKEKPPVWQTAVVERGDIERTVTALGALRPKDYVAVGAQVSGQLMKVHVEVGDRVESGQLLAEIDARGYESSMQSSEANLERLKAQLVEREAQVELARAQLKRNESLMGAKALSQQSFEESEAALKVVEAQVQSIQAEIKAAESTLRGDSINLGYTKIYAPMSGTVVSEAAVAGQTVNASQATPEILTIADLETMTVWAEVSEADVVRIHPGMEAYFTTLGMPDRRWYGKVRQVQPTPEIVNDVVLYNVLVDVDNSEQLLMRDMTAQVSFVLEKAEDAVLAPVAALQKRGKHYAARVLTPEGVEVRKVEVGVSNRSQAQILSGLEAGEQVITGSASVRPARPPGGGGGRPPTGPRF